MVRSGDPVRTAAVSGVILEADEALSLPITSVLDKVGIAPSGEKQDFWAIGAYSWPNPATRNGLPYVYRDSEYNPEAYQSATYDKGAYSGMVAAVKVLALAWYFTADTRYASRAADVLRTWFIDPATRMHPHFRHAAARPGEYDGHHSGGIEGVILIEMLDYVALLSDAPEWSDTDLAGMRQWFAEMSDWYAHSTFGRAEASTTNNHSSYYLAQVMAFACFAGNDHRARAVIPLAKRQLRAQVAADGMLPREIARPNSYYYALYGLRAFVILARLAERYDADLWRYSRHRHESPVLARGLAWLAPYCSGLREWTLPRHESGHPKDALAVYWLAARAYDARVLHDVVAHLSETQRTGHSTLVYGPLAQPTDTEAAWFTPPEDTPIRPPSYGGPCSRAKRIARSALVSLRLMPEGRIP